MARDLHRNLKTARVIDPIAIGTTGTGKTGKIVDRAGYEGVEFILAFGSVTATNATIVPVIKEGDATSAMTSVANADLLGLEVNAGIAQGTPRTSGVNKNVTKRIGYIGSKRYVQCNLVNTITAGPVVSVVGVLGFPRNAPLAT